MNDKRGLGNLNVNRVTGEPMKPTKNFNNGGPAEPSLLDIAKMIVKSIIEFLMGGVKITFPENYFNPEGSDSFDIRALDIYNAGETKVLMTYRAKEGQTIKFIKYGFFTNIVLADNVKMHPTINGLRILRYHGDPDHDFAINLSVGPDLTEDSMIPCDVTLNTGDVLEITATNTSGTQAEIGARFRGFIQNANNTQNRGFGG